uniref:protein mono-ADP-ribosyltransferase PARP8-like n=1 Tax=Myxine glutinosa TaxID=7769 RepID=UPI00358E0A96
MGHEAHLDQEQLSDGMAPSSLSCTDLHISISGLYQPRLVWLPLVLVEVMSVLNAVLTEIKLHLEYKDPLAYPLLKWVIESVTIPIVKLPVDQQLGFMRTRNQFLFLTAPSERDAEFCSARRMYGSAFAFHGSKVWNWHSIIHQGLLNFSGTNPEVLDGAPYGKGIHTSPYFTIASQYSDIRVRHRKVKIKPSKYKNDQLFMKGQEIKCVALCEVIKSPSLKENGGTWVISNPAHICIRFLFVYEDNNTPYFLYTKEPVIKNAILHTMARYIPLDDLAS